MAAHIRLAGTPAVRAGQGLKLEKYMSRWADPKVRLAGMDAARQNLQVVSRRDNDNPALPPFLRMAQDYFRAID